MFLVCPAIFDYQKGTSSTSKLALRDWPIKSWNHLIYLLEEKKLVFNIITTKNLKKNFKTQNDNIICPSNLNDLFEYIKNADLILTQDSGFMHIARYFKKKVIVLFGPTNPYIFTGGNEIVIRDSNLKCSPCHDGRNFTNCNDNACMKSIQPEYVYRVVLEVMQSLKIN